MGIDFIDFFERSIYGNIYIYNLVNYFSKRMYPHTSTGVDIKNIIFLFDYYLQANLKPYVV